MADNVIADPGSGGSTFATDDIGGVHYPRSKVVWGPDGTANDADVASGKPLPVQLRTPLGDSVADDTADAIKITDAGGSLTVDNAALSVTGGGVEASALRVTIASDSTGVLSVDDNGGSLTIDGTVTIGSALPAGTNNIGDVDVLTLPATTNAGATAKTADYDTGAGTDTVTLFGIALPASGGAVSGGTATNPVRVDPTGTTAQPITDNGGSLTVDGTVAATQSGTWTVQPGNTANTTPWLASIHDGTTLATVRNLAANDALNVAIVDGSGAQITSFGGSGGTSATDDAAFTAASGSGTPMMGFVTADSVDTGDVGVVGMLANRQLKVTLYDSTGVEQAVGGGTQYTEDAAAAANPVGTALNLIRDDARAGSLTTADGDNVAARGTNAGELYVKHVDAIPVTDNAGSLTVDNAALSVTGGGVEASALRVTLASDSTGLLSVDDNGGSLTIDGTVAISSLPASTNTIEVVGDAAHDAVAAGNPVLVGAYASASAPADVSADGDAVNLWADRAGRLQIGDGGGSLTIDGTVTANAGTNLNTSALALETGGNLAGAATSLAILDDWDETDRAKVNIIVGQAGVTAGAGAVAANTQRVTLASDDPAVVSLQILDNAIAGSEMQVDVITLPALAAGTNNIGDVDVLTLPASTKTLVRVAGTAASSGNNTIVAAQGAGNAVHVINYALQAQGTVTAQYTDGAGGTALTLPWKLQDREGAFGQPTVVPQYHFKTSDNTALVLNLSGAITVGYELTYWVE